MDERIDTLKMTIRILEWDKSRGQLNPGRKALLEGYIKELETIEAKDG